MAPSALSYVGPPMDDPATFDRLPHDLRRLLEERNGFIAYRGGLHVRGVCSAPHWHSLGYWWRSDDAIQRLFPAVLGSDVPFAQDMLGDQYVLRDGEVHRLSAEIGELQPLSLGLTGFLDAVEQDPEGVLALEPLLHFLDEGGVLEPGQLLSVYPPFVAAESREGVTMNTVPVHERLSFLSKLALAVGEQEDGGRLRIDTEDQDRRDHA